MSTRRILVLTAWGFYALFSTDTLANEVPQNYPSLTDAEKQPALSTIGNQLRNILHFAPDDSEAIEKRKELREIEELDAQKETAYWAEPMFWATVSSGGLAGLSILGLFVTIRQNKKNIKLATDTFDHTRKTSQAQLRAYVSASLTESHRELFTKKPHPFLAVTFRNSGSTPALDFKYFMEAVFVPTAEADTYRSPAKDFYTMGSKIILPNQEQTATRLLYDDSRPLKMPGLINNVAAKTHCIFVYGVATYSDVFGDTHRTEFKHRIFHHKEGKVIALFAPDGNDAD